MWNLDSDRPIYLQIIEEIQRRIITGQYRPGERLPSVRELADEASVNPNTMQKAMVELERTGLVYTQRTNGRFITEDHEMIKMLKSTLAKDQIRAFLETMKHYGYEAEEVASLILSYNNVSKQTGLEEIK